MKVLGIDSSGTVASVAVISDNKVLADVSSDTALTHSQTLLPMIEMAIKMSKIDKKDIDLIAISCGPGSFTGLRIGAGTAKGLALGLGVPIAPVLTLDVLANRLPFAKGIICPIMNARRNQVYTAAYRNIYQKDSSNYLPMERVLPMDAMGIDELFTKLKELNEDVLFTGDGVEVFRDKIEGEFKEEFSKEVSIAPEYAVKQSAAVVAFLGQKLHEDGQSVKINEFELTYLRKSQAEREKEEKHKNES